MFKLLKKEMKLTANILSYIFIAGALMTLIPNYPILIGTFFVCLGIFYTFQSSREANDITYTVMLPVKKKDIVTAKFAFSVAIQVMAYFVCLILTLVRMFVLNNIEPYSQCELMNANLAYLGYVMIVFSCFNVFFIGGYFKTAYKLGVPFLIFVIAAIITVIVGEGLHFIFEELNYSYHYSHIIILAIGASVYSGATVTVWLLAQKKFCEIDL